jgi:hypothetical protein
MKPVPCERCGDLCQPGESSRPTARPFRKAQHGYCHACVVCLFFRSEGDHGLGYALPPEFDPEGLRLPHVQAQFGRVLVAGGSELTMDEIDWSDVIRKWSLPLKGTR